MFVIVVVFIMRKVYVVRCGYFWGVFVLGMWVGGIVGVGAVGPCLDSPLVALLCMFPTVILGFPSTRAIPVPRGT